VQALITALIYDLRAEIRLEQHTNGLIPRTY